MNSDDTNLKIGFGVWVCICLLVSLWMISKFLKGKRQVFSNLHVVEDSLRKMQEMLELDQRKRSMGCMDMESFEELTRHFNSLSTKEEKHQNQQEDNDEGNQLITSENEVGKVRSVAEAENVEDKKNI